MKTKQIEIYNYDELSQDAKDKALSNYAENIDHYFLEDNLSEYLGELLEQKEVKALNKQLSYSLGYCQGDGVCFSGQFEYKGVTFTIEHNDRYSHKNSVTIEAEAIDNSEEDELKADLIDVITTEVESEFKNIYSGICDAIEKNGYAQIEYDQSEEAFKEFCDANDVTFRENGERED